MAAPSRPRPDVPAEFESLETLHEARAPASPQEDAAPEDTGQEDGLAPILTIRPPDPDKDAARAQYGQDLSFLSAVLRGDETEAEKLLEQGADVNVHDPEHGATALHFAASRSMRRVLKLLIRQTGIDYLVRDHKGRLPSAYAWEIAADPVIGRFLVRKEVAQAHERGIDYRALIGDEKRA